jgi:hypothetical protein
MTCRVALNIAKHAVAAGAAHVNDQPDEETDDPLVADVRNLYKVEKWTRDGMRVDSLLYAGNNFSKAQEVFANVVRSEIASLAFGLAPLLLLKLCHSHGNRQLLRQYFGNVRRHDELHRD